MTPCYLIQDLLPSYIDGLVQKETENEIQQHLQQCESCRALYTRLSAPIEQTPAVTDKKHIDFLKKVRKAYGKKMAIGFAACLLIFALFTYFMAIGTPVSKPNLQYTTRIAGDMWQIEMELTNGKALLVRTEPIYGEADDSGVKPIVGVLLKPHQVIPSPLLERGNNRFLFGTSTDSFHKPYKVVLRLADGDIVFSSENIVQP